MYNNNDIIGMTALSILSTLHCHWTSFHMIKKHVSLNTYSIEAYMVLLAFILFHLTEPWEHSELPGIYK